MHTSKEPTFIVRDMRHKERFQVDDEYMNGWARILGPHTTVVYFDLCRHANTEQKAWPSIERLASRLRMTKPTVIKALKELEACSIVGIIRGKDSGGHQAVNVYVLIDKSVWKKEAPSKRRLPGTGSTSSLPPGKPAGSTTFTVRSPDRRINTNEGKNESVDNSDRTTKRPESVADILDRTRTELERRGILKRKP